MGKRRVIVVDEPDAVDQLALKAGEGCGGCIVNGCLLLLAPWIGLGVGAVFTVGVLIVGFIALVIMVLVNS
jgi:hypothetical protein